MFKNLFLGTAYLFFVTLSAIGLNQLQPGAGIFFAAATTLFAFCYVSVKFLP